MALCSEEPLQTRAQGLEGQSINKEWKDVRNENSQMGKDEDSEEEGGTVQVSPAEVWA